VHLVVSYYKKSSSSLFVLELEFNYILHPDKCCALLKSKDFRHIKHAKSQQQTYKGLAYYFSTETIQSKKISLLKIKLSA